MRLFVTLSFLTIIALPSAGFSADTTNTEAQAISSNSGPAAITRMSMVRRLYDFSKDIPAIRTANEPGHQKHLLKFGQTIVSSALLADDGTRIGSVSISDIADMETINSYVYDDPFTQGGIYKDITIEQLDVYKIDGRYNRAPAWFAPELERRQKANGFDRAVKPTGTEPAPAMYLIQKSYADRAVVESIIERLQDAHHIHLTTYGANVVSASIKNTAGKNTAGKNTDGLTVRSLAIGDYGSWENAARFVYEDPFTRAGMFDQIVIERVDLYKLDGSYERAPAWFYDQMKEQQLSVEDR